LDQPTGLLRRAFTGFWFSYWLPLSFETPARRDMLRHGVVNELDRSGFRSLKRTPAA